MKPNDPLYGKQWYLGLIGDIETIWNDYNGRGVHVGVYDSGVDSSHAEFRGRYDATRQVVVNGVSQNGNPNDASTQKQSHGTNCAGLISAGGDNGTGMIGIAFGTTLTGVNIFDTTAPTYLNAADPSGFFSAIRQMTKFDVTNNSWGSPGKFTSEGNLNDPASFDARLVKEYGYVSANGRGGLGTVIVQSAGNEGFEANGTGVNASRFTITVAAAQQSGFASSYSNHGASVLVTAPGSETDGSILTTDRTGTPGESTGDYNPHFNGTSAAAPIVSGVVALMLQANSNLGWRDVQNILAASASHTGSQIGASVSGDTESQTWQINEADTWNGGGMHFSQDYGYGMVNAYNAVRMAEAQTLISATAQTSANEKVFSTGPLAIDNTVVPNGSSLTVSFEITAAMLLEHVALTLTFDTSYFNALNIYATSAEGTNIRLYDGLSGEADAAANGLTWTFGIDSLRGELAAGTWTVTFVDIYGFDVDYARFTEVAFTAYGTTPTTGDTYRYTDEFGLMAAQEAGRATLNDTDGGIDWIEASAVARGSVIDLRAGSTSTIAGRQLTMGSGVIENVATGDGGDVIIANGATNTLAGGRGSDTYYVDGASDKVIEKAGAGSDTIVASVSYTLGAGQSVEKLLAAARTGTAAIDLTGNAIANTLEGTAGANVLNGGGGVDRMVGFAGSDTYFVDTAGDVVIEAANGGMDRIVSTVSYTLAVGQSIERLQLAAATGTAALSLTGNAFANTLIGNSGKNRLDGGAGIDVLQGGKGDDTYIVDHASDKVIEAAGAGTDTVLAKVSYTLAAGQSVQVLQLAGSTGTAALGLTGNEIANTLIGNAGNNSLDGKLGDDVLKGEAGVDTLIGGLGRDMLAGGSGNDIFLFKTAAESGIGTAKADQILDFTSGDHIDLRLIDANASVSGDQAFKLDTNASFSAGEIRQTVVGDDLRLDFNTDADSAVEMSIMIMDHGALGSGDFML